MRFSAETVVLAAGALNTPRILLESHSSLWPNGLANRSGLVGRNLMRHYVDIYALKTTPGDDGRGSIKELAFNNFYSGPNGAYGTVQSFGLLPPAEVLTAQLAKDLRDGPLAAAAGLLETGKPLMRSLLQRMFDGRVLLAAIVEDLPSPENRVTLSPNRDKIGRRGLRLHYRISDGEVVRVAALRKKLCALFKPFRPMLLKQAENNERLAHVCGTCRYGDDPKTSVLNAACRTHDVENMFVADASFFPTSGGTNPALTVAAGALRAAERFTGQAVRNHVANAFACAER
jgi:choline dehydrogenase-like flavoprotein